MQNKRIVCPHCKNVIQEDGSRYPRDGDCYKPEETLVSYLTKLTGDEEDSDGTLSKEEQSEQKKKRQSVLKSKKYIVLNKYIFPSMANLTLFFTLVATSPRLRGLFDEDIQALLFPESQTNRGVERVFERFIDAVLAVDQHTPPEDFRFALIDITQHKIWDQFVGIGPFKLNNLLVNSVLLPDMGRAVSWTSFFATEAYGNISFDKDRRPVLF